MTKQKLFFSYSRIDGAAFALRLAVDLKKKGFDVWIDQEDIRAGLEWDTEIEKALESCDCVLFLETEKSVVSNNVLDEVYYALEQNKKVIPLIYVDSRTPFRLKRLQHIDFTKDYDTGFNLLVNELEGNTPAVTYQPNEEKLLTAPKKPFYTKKYLILVTIAFFALLITAIVLLTTKNKNVAPSESKEPIALTDTITNKGGELIIVPEIPVNDSLAKEKANSPDKVLPKENRNKQQGKKPAGRSEKENTGPVESKGGKTESSLSILNEMVAGDWRLTGIEPKAQSHNGYLKIEALGENKATIKSYIQFYYPDSKASSYLTIFNAFAGCNSCTVNREMKLKAEDIAIGSRTIKKLLEDQPGGGKAGDVILDASSNKSIRGSITLQFTDDNNAVIIVKQPLAIELANELMLEPFVYTFRFKKNE